MARPKIAAELKRTRHVNVAMSEAEYATLANLAARAGLAPAEALRELGLRGEVCEATPALNAKAWADLGRFQGATARLLCITGIDAEARNLIAKLIEEVRALRMTLIGNHDEAEA